MPKKSNSQNQGKTQGLTTENDKKQVTNKFFRLILGLLAFFTVTSSLFHIFFKPKSEEYIKHYNSYSGIIKKRDNGTKELLKQFQTVIKGKSKDSITILTDQLVLDYEQHYINSRNELKNYSKISKDLASKHSFRGRSSFRYWIYLFGIVLVGLLFSCKSLYHDMKEGSTYKTHFLSLSGICVSLFWAIHLIFLTHKDFKQSNYILLILLCAVMSTYFTYRLVKYFKYKDDIIRNLIQFIIRVKETHMGGLAVKSLYASRTGEPMCSEEEVCDALDEFDRDLQKTIAKV